MSHDDVRLFRLQARACIAAGDLPEALQHLAQALANHPNDPESLAVLDAIAEHAPAPLDLVSDQSPSDFAGAAVRAHLLQHDGQFAAAVTLLLLVIQARPDLPFATWLNRWQKSPSALLNLSNDEVRQIASGIAEVLRQHPGVPAASDHRLTFECLLELVDALRELSSARSKLALLASSLLRRIDEHPRAQRVAQQTYELEPTAGAAMLVALASRQQGNFATAIEWLKRALEHEPEDTGYLLELADCHLDNGDFAAAASCYDHVLKEAPEHPWALPARMYTGWLRGEQGQQESLAELAEHSEAAATMHRRCEHLPFETSLPLPQDPAAHAVFDVLEQLARAKDRRHSARRSGELQIQLEYPEAPSVLLALQLALSLLDHDLKLTVTTETIPTPDPRSPKRADAIQLWSFDEGRASPAVARPSPLACERVAAIAPFPFRLSAWRTRIAESAAEEPIPESELLATLVHPPPPQNARGSLVWLQHVQMAAALCLLEQGAIDSLIGIALGSTDWSTTVAIVALATAAREDEAIRPRIQEVFEQLDTHIPDAGYCCYAYPLAVCWAWFNDAMATELWRRRRRLELAPGS